MFRVIASLIVLSGATACMLREPTKSSASGASEVVIKSGIYFAGEATAFVANQNEFYSLIIPRKRDLDILVTLTRLTIAPERRCAELTMKGVISNDRDGGKVLERPSDY